MWYAFGRVRVTCPLHGDDRQNVPVRRGESLGSEPIISDKLYSYARKVADTFGTLWL